MKIVKLEAQNVKRLKAVEITPSGSTVIIGGRNGQGKTSVIDSIAYALGGKGAVCERPVRDGQDKARVVCQLDDMIVTRTFTADGGGTLTVTSADGKARFATPQKMLDALVGRLTFDPLAFLRMKPTDQLATLKELVGLDFSPLEQQRKSLYEQRTQTNRDIKHQESALAGLAQHADAPAEEVSIRSLVEKLDAANAVNQAKRSAWTQAMDCEQIEQSIVEKVQHAEGQIAQWQKVLADRKAQLDAHRQKTAALKQQAEAMPEAETEPIRQAIESAETVNQKVRENRARANVAKRLEDLRAEAGRYTAEMERIDKAKAEALAAAKFPIAGLAFGDSGVTFNGCPFEQCSSAEQLRVSFAMCVAMNPKLRVALIRDASLLDDDAMKLVAELAAANDFQVWLEVVRTDGDVQVVIEDGAVKASGLLPTDTDREGPEPGEAELSQEGHPTDERTQSEVDALDCEPEEAPAERE